MWLELKAALKKQSMSQKELADKLGYTQQSISKWVNGKGSPNTDTLESINKILGVNLPLPGKQRITRIMKKMDLSKIDNYEKALQETKTILSETEIINHYSYSIQMICKWLFPAVIGLTYHQYLSGKEHEQIDYENIGCNLQDLFEPWGREMKEGFQGSCLEHSFSLVEEELFESFDEYKIEDDEYCRMIIDGWYKFLLSAPTYGSAMYDELKVAIMEIVDLM